jgi:hypothetical protein
MLRSHLRLAAAIVSAAGLVFVASAQSQDTQSPSVAEAARRAKEAKNKASAKSKVITDEDLAARRVKPGEEGLFPPVPAPAPTSAPASEPAPASGPATPPAASAGAQPAEQAAPKPPADDAAARKKVSVEIARLKKQLASEEEALNLDQREAALAQDSYYSQTDYARDTAGKAKLDALQQQIADQQQKVQDLKARLAALEASEASASAPDSTPAAPPPAALQN